MSDLCAGVWLEVPPVCKLCIPYPPHCALPSHYRPCVLSSALFQAYKTISYMSYQVLARKWRPQTFHTMVGQEHVLQALINALDNQRLHHAYLFTGTRGVGKTTIARILAKCLNCETGITSQPCGQCSSCQEIAAGRFVDLIEVDAASRTRVEDTREILDNVQYAPSRGRFKVYLIDEVHMLSNSSFNALLKTLEEPPAHVKFLLATTDPQKLPPTILSRCLQFSLKNMTPERIVGYLQHVLGEEQVAFEDPALWLLGRAAQGSMRDALSLTDQAISFGQGQLKENDVAAMLGTVDRGRVFALANALASQDVGEVLNQIAKMAEHAIDFANVLADLIELLHRVAIAQALPDAIDNSQGDREYVMALADAISPADVQLFYQTALMGKRDLPLAPEPRAGLEMTLLRMLTFRPVVEGELPKKLSSRPRTASETAVAGPAAPLAPVAFKPAPPSAPVNTQPAPVAEKPASVVAPVTPAAPVVHSAAVQKETTPQTAADDFPPWLDEPEGDMPAGFPQEDDAPAQSVFQPELTQVVAPAVQTSVVQSPVVHPPVEAKPVPEVVMPAPVAQQSQEAEEPLQASELTSHTWPVMFPRLGLDGMLKSLMSNSSLMQFDGQNALFHLDPGHLRLLNDNHQQKFIQVFCAAFGAAIRVQIQEGDCQYETPAQRQQRLAYEKQQRAIDSIMADAHVQTLQSAFNAQVIMDSIEPLI